MTEHPEQLAMGTWVLALVVMTAFSGVFVGIASARKAATVLGGRHRMMWLAWGALSIGGVGLWLPKIIGLVGVEIGESGVRYDILWIVGSLLLSVAVCYAALYVVSPVPNRHRMPSGSVELGRLLTGGAILAVGAILVHLALITGVEIRGEIEYDIVMISVSALVSLVAAALVVWSVQAGNSRLIRLGASFAAGLGFAGAHYIGIYALVATVDPTSPLPDGIDIFSVLFPAYVLGLLVLTIPITALLMAPDRIAAELEFEADALAEEPIDHQFERA
ncbi:MAG: hypothetical protein GX610_03375 [Rhodococcus sp.]|nr:hypothetical protein [Rhodococcus sp. (in: high G+C Gram-positive bacteria)]